MHKHLAVLTVFLAILCHSQASPGQSNVSTAAPQALAANGSGTSGGSSNKTESQDVSKKAREEAKRLYKMGVKYGRGGLFRQASELFQKAVQLNPNYADAHYGLGLALFDQGRWEDAIRSFQNVVKINPKDKEAREKLYEAYVLGRNTNPAGHTEKETVAADPLSPNVSSESPPKIDTAAAFRFR